MSKNYKLYQLKGTIDHAWLGQSKSKQWKNQPFYYLDITQESLFTKKTKVALYAFPNLVSPEIWKTLAQASYQQKKYLFTCEKRTRGWRLKAWEELHYEN